LYVLVTINYSNVIYYHGLPDRWTHLYLSALTGIDQLGAFVEVLLREAGAADVDLAPVQKQRLLAARQFRHVDVQHVALGGATESRKRLELKS
jgi:hypothetical protein